MGEVRTLIRGASLKALIATMLFVIFYLFYNIEFVRDKVEDFAFDTVNKFTIFKKEQSTQSPNVFIFAVDDLYMKTHALFDDENRSNYGYLFPRDQIAAFIETLDELVSELDEGNYPKALFIDYDFSFTSMPYGRTLSAEDTSLLNALKRPHQYTIFLPKTDTYNFIEESNDPAIQKKIHSGQIRFVSVSLLQSGDSVRRYLGMQTFSKHDYLSTDIALWQQINHTETNPFKKDDIVANRILFKAYHVPVKEEECTLQQSYWKKLRKYSANCSLFEVPYEDFNQSILMLGGTHSHNDDRFTILNIFGSKTYSGIDIHANTLMSMFFLNGPLQRLSLLWSILLVFVVFFLTDLFVNIVLKKYHIDNEKLILILLLLPSATILFAISVYLLNAKHLWFNWSIPFILFQFVEIIILVRKKSTKVIFKIGKLLKR